MTTTTTTIDQPQTTADTKPTCPVCGATTGLRRLNDIAPDLRTPSTAPDYHVCDDFDACLNRALKAAGELIQPDTSGTPTDEPDD